MEGESPDEPTVIVDAESDEGVGLDTAALDEVAEAVRRVIAVDGGRAGVVELRFVGVDEIRELNEAHLGGTGPTDVVSFPIDDDPDDPLASLGGPPLLGSIVICPEISDRQAAGHVGDVRGERLLLGIHGALHVLGHDHAEPGERAVMQAREAEHLAVWGVEHPGDPS